MSAERGGAPQSGGDWTLRVGGTPLLRFCDPPAAVRELLVATYGRLLRHGGDAPLSIEFRAPLSGSHEVHLSTSGCGPSPSTDVASYCATGTVDAPSCRSRTAIGDWPWTPLSTGSGKSSVLAHLLADATAHLAE
ncbi:MAG: hypothetical protein KY452_02800 [Actinobacteria bacterium]|nr:hypothetical protein [Actinomycetota bacterium]